MATTCPTGFDVAGLRALDVVISNGVVNLAPDKSRVFAEIYRVLRPGGRLYLADVVVQRELKYEVRNNPDLCAACIAGALPESELAELAIASRLRDPQITERSTAFGTPRQRPRWRVTCTFRQSIYGAQVEDEIVAEYRAS